MSTTSGLLLCVALGAACAATPKLTRRFASVEYAPAPHCAPLVTVNVVATSAPSPTQTPIGLRLSDHGQAALVHSIAAGTPQTFRRELAGYFETSRPSGPGDRTRLRAHLVIEHQAARRDQLGRGDLFSEADRIMALDVHLTPDGAEFSGWNRFETVFGTVDLGEITAQQKRTFSAKLEPTFAGTLVGAGELGGSNEKTLSEKLVLKERIVAISGILEDDSARIVQEGGLGLDLQGNVSVQLEMELPGRTVMLSSFEGLFDSKGLPRPGPDVVFSIHPTKIPYPTGAIGISARSDYRYRHVKDGEKTVVEGDDRVVVYHGWTKVDRVEVLSEAAREELATLHRLGDVEGEEREWVQIQRGWFAQDVVLGTEDEARALQRWLLAQEKFPLVVGSGANTWTFLLGGELLAEQHFRAPNSDVGRLHWHEFSEPGAGTE